MKSRNVLKTVCLYQVELHNRESIFGRTGMKNILIISEYFAPENIIAAIRPTKLAKYLKKTGKYHITVLTTIKTSKTRDSILENDLQFVDDLINVNGTNIVGNFIQRLLHSKGPILSQMLSL